MRDTVTLTSVPGLMARGAKTGLNLGPVGLPVIRVCLALFGLAAIAWAITTLPVFWRYQPVINTASQVIAGDVFLGGGLSALEPTLATIDHSPSCVPFARRAAAVIRLRLAEDTLHQANETEQPDSSLSALREGIVQSLSCAPPDPFLWAALFWVDNTVEGLSPSHFAYLRMSYALGPNEGWISLKRSPYALALLAELPPDLARDAIAEFKGLINTGFIREAATILTASGWRDRDLLIPSLKDLRLDRREALAKAVYDAGFDINIPGVRQLETRPWR